MSLSAMLESNIESGSSFRRLSYFHQKALSVVLPVLVIFFLITISLSSFGVSKEVAEEMLRRKKVKPNILTLFERVENGDATVTRLILNTGISPDSVLNLGLTPLMVAAEHDHADVIEVLVEEGANSDLKDEVFGKTALMIAAEKGNQDAVKALIRGNVDLDDRSERRVSLGVVIEGGETALMLAAKANQPKVVKILIEAAARVDLKNESGEDALAIAEKKGYTEVVKFLRDAMRGSSGSEQRLAAE